MSETIAGYEVHPAASTFPILPLHELAELATDIRERGQIEDIVLHQGKVLDGRNRLAACQRLGVVPRTREWDGEGGTPVGYVAALNIRRRHLTESQRAMIAADLLPHFQAEAKERQREHGGTAPGRPSTQRPGAESEPPVRAKASEPAAAVASVSSRSVERAKFVAERSPDLAEKVKAGTATLKQAEKQIRKADQVVKVAAYVPPAGVFNVIVADPPWKYDDELEGDGARGGLPYPPMGLGEICALKIPADKDCVLWLWVTNAHLIDGSAAAVLEAWGFEGKTLKTWKKDRMGTGTWLRGITEHVILATKGSPTVNLTNQTTFFEAPRREHSRKPDTFYAEVEQLCPGKARLEMFSRSSRPGWTTAGAEAGKFDAPADTITLPEFAAAAKAAGFEAWREGQRVLRIRCLTCKAEFPRELLSPGMVLRGELKLFDLHRHDRKPAPHSSSPATAAKEKPKRTPAKEPAAAPPKKPQGWSIKKAPAKPAAKPQAVPRRGGRTTALDPAALERRNAQVNKLLAKAQEKRWAALAKAKKTPAPSSRRKR